MMPSEFTIDFVTVKQAATIERVIDYLGLTHLRARGSKQWRGQCPLCKVPDSFVITADGGKDKLGAFYCFKCQVGGDQLELASRLKGHGPRDSKGVLEAAKDFHQKFIGTVPNTSPGPEKAEKETSRRKPGFDTAAYAKSLDAHHLLLKELGVSSETLIEWSCGYAGTGIHRGKLALALADRSGTVLAFVGWSLKEDGTRITAPNGFDLRAHIFGLGKLEEGPWTLLHDPVAVLKAAEAGASNCVAFLTEDVTADQLLLLAAQMKQSKTDTLILM